VDGVRVSLKSAGEVEKAFLDITSRARRLRPQAYITGCLVQEMAPQGAKEVIVGFARDDQFGPLLMFGMGGIYVEVLKDISFKLAPVTRTEASEMVRGIRSSMLLRGVRGENPVNIQAIEDIILRLSQLAMDFPGIAEAECNPVLVNQEKAVVADARMTVS
jgi:acetyltransferase